MIAINNEDEKLICFKCKEAMHDLNKLEDFIPIWIPDEIPDGELVCDDCLDDLEEISIEKAHKIYKEEILKENK